MSSNRCDFINMLYRAVLKRLVKDADTLFREYEQADPIHLQSAADANFNLGQHLQMIESKLK